MASATTLDAARYTTECKAKSMIMDLGSSYRPKTALPTVSAFQDAWNTLLPSVKGMAGVLLPSSNGGKLIIDGLYGGQTATAADNFLPPGAQQLPSAASSMPTWFTSNHMKIDAMCPPAQTSDPLPPPVALTPPPVQQVVADRQALPSSVPMDATAPSVQSQMPPPIAPVPVMTTPEPISTQTIHVYSAQSIPVTPAPPPAPTPPPEVVKAVATSIPLPKTVTVPQTQITAAPQKGAGTMLIALGLGGAVLAAGVGFLLYRRHA
jgi:hypothetical protein